MGKHLLNYSGIWADIPENSWNELTKQVKNVRVRFNKSSKKRRVKLDLL